MTRKSELVSVTLGSHQHALDNRLINAGGVAGPVYYHYVVRVILPLTNVLALKRKKLSKKLH